ASAISALLDDQRKLDMSSATTLDRQNADVLSFYLRHGLSASWIGKDGHAFRFHDYPVNHFYGAQSMLVALMTQGHRIAGKADAENYLQRLTRFPAAIDGLIESVLHRRKLGITLPRRCLERVVKEVRFFAGAPPQSTPLFSSLRGRLSKLALGQSVVD